MENRDVKIEKDGIAHILHLDENDKPTSKKKITQPTTQDTIKKSILSLANLTIGYSIIQIVILPLYMLLIKESSVLTAVLIVIFFIPILISGIRMRKIGDTDTGKIKRIITFLIIYSIIIVLLSLFGGGRPSILVFILLYKLFKTKKEIKKDIPEDIIEKKIQQKESSEQDKKKKRKMTTKSWMIIAIITVVTSLIVIYITKQKPTHSTPTTETFTQEFVRNYKSHIPNNWEIIDLEDLGLIAIPQTLEVREEGSSMDMLSKSFSGTFNEMLGSNIPEHKLVIQQAGLSGGTKESSSTYARVIIDVRKVKEGEVPSRNDRINLTQKDLNMLKTSAFPPEATLKSMNCSAEERTVEEVYINKMNSIKLTYLRRCGNFPDTYVEQYKFFNYNEVVEITLSYRVNDSDIWKEDFSRIIDTFILTN